RLRRAGEERSPDVPHLLVHRAEVLAPRRQPQLEELPRRRLRPGGQAGRLRARLQRRDRRRGGQAMSDDVLHCTFVLPAEWDAERRAIADAVMETIGNLDVTREARCEVMMHLAVGLMTAFAPSHFSDQ